LAFIGYSYRNDEEPQTYTSALQIGIRDIDPSLLVSRTHYDGWGQWPRTWWVPVELNMRPVPVQERLAWRDKGGDLVNDARLIDVQNPRDGRRWLALESFQSWRQRDVVNGKNQSQRETWFRLNCVVVRREHEAKMLDWLRDRRLTSPHDLPEMNTD